MHAATIPEKVYFREIVFVGLSAGFVGQNQRETEISDNGNSLQELSRDKLKKQE